MVSRAVAIRRCSRSARSRTPRSSPARPPRRCSRHWRLSGSRSTPSVHARWLGNRQALAQVRKRIADVEHAYNEQVEGAAHGPSLMAGADRVLAREYEAQLQAGGHPPMLYAQISLAVGAASEEELERRVAVLKEQYGDITLHRPAGLQHQLWLDHLPRADGWV